MLSPDPNHLNRTRDARGVGSRDHLETSLQLGVGSGCVSQQTVTPEREPGERSHQVGLAGLEGGMARKGVPDGELAQCLARQPVGRALAGDCGLRDSENSRSQSLEGDQFDDERV